MAHNTQRLLTKEQVKTTVTQGRFVTRTSGTSPRLTAFDSMVLEESDAALRYRNRSATKTAKALWKCLKSLREWRVIAAKPSKRPF